jgi:hypothetical protein
LGIGRFNTLLLGNSSAVTGPALTVLGVVLGGILEANEDILERVLEEPHSEHAVSSLFTEVDCRSVKSFRQSSQ